MADSTTPLKHRIPGRRKGKPLGPSRLRLLNDVLPAFQISFGEDESDIDPHRWFTDGTDTTDLDDIWLEIGFGKGEHLAWQAAHNPSVGIIGCEPFETGVAGLVADIESQKFTNVRVFTEDAAWLLENLASASLSRAFLLFPDPWPKGRHHKRRFVTHERLDLLARALKDNAEFRIATDHEDYATWIVRHMSARPDFEWLDEGPGDWRVRTAPPEGDWPGTRYEGKALKRGAQPIYLRYRRRPR